MARKNKNAGERRECSTGPGAQAAPVYFLSPLGRPKITRRKRPEVVM